MAVLSVKYYISKFAWKKGFRIVFAWKSDIQHGYNVSLNGSMVNFFLNTKCQCFTANVKVSIYVKTYDGNR